MEPRVSVILPTLQSESHIQTAIASILNQTYTDYELIVVDDGSTDHTRDIIETFDDPRIELVDGPRTGLANALNLGIKTAKGEYLARMDSDDISIPGRLEKQVAFMDSHPDIAVCGGWQEHYGKNSYIHRTPENPEQCKANLLFQCDVCHSLVMMRRQFLLDNDLFYNGDYLAEDYELWNRVVSKGKICNLQEVLGRYLEGDDNITCAKLRDLGSEQASISRRILESHLGMEVSDRECVLLRGWCSNPRGMMSEFAASEKDALEGIRGFYRRILDGNGNTEYYSESALLGAMEAKLYNLIYNVPFFVPDKSAKNLDEMFSKLSRGHALMRRWKSFSSNNPTFSMKLKKMGTILGRPSR